MAGFLIHRILYRFSSTKRVFMKKDTSLASVPTHSFLIRGFWLVVWVVKFNSREAPWIYAHSNFPTSKRILTSTWHDSAHWCRFHSWLFLAVRIKPVKTTNGHFTFIHSSIVNWPLATLPIHSFDVVTTTYTTIDDRRKESIDRSHFATWPIVISTTTTTIATVKTIRLVIHSFIEQFNSVFHTTKYKS